MKKSQLRSLIHKQIKESYVNEMQMINKETGKDVTRHLLDYMENKITKKEFEELAGVSKDTNINENESDLPGEESMANRDIKALEELLKKYSIEKINITLRILDDPTHWKNPEIRTPEEKEMFQNRHLTKTAFSS